jgi:hypothetical protein
MVFALPLFTLPDNKEFVVELYERNGGRRQRFTVDNADLLRAKTIHNLKTE